MNRTARAAALLATAVLAAAILAGVPSPASAHGAGSGTISQSASFVLTPPGTQTWTFHAYLSSIGLPIGPGDTLRFSWSVATPGTPVLFQIHAHPSTGGFVIFYNTTSIGASDSWVVPNIDGIMVLWENHNPENVTVSYSFQLVPPASDPILYLVTLGAVIAAVLVVLRIRWWRASKSGKDPEKAPPRSDRNAHSSSKVSPAESLRGSGKQPR